MTANLELTNTITWGSSFFHPMFNVTERELDYILHSVIHTVHILLNCINVNTEIKYQKSVSPNFILCLLIFIVGKLQNTPKHETD